MKIPVENAGQRFNDLLTQLQIPKEKPSTLAVWSAFKEFALLDFDSTDEIFRYEAGMSNLTNYPQYGEVFCLTFARHFYVEEDGGNYYGGAFECTLLFIADDQKRLLEANIMDDGDMLEQFFQKVESSSEFSLMSQHQPICLDAYQFLN